MRARGFTLLELMVASAMATIIATAAVSTSVMIQRSLTSARKVGILDERRELLEEFFGPLLRQTGQNTVKPWEAVLTICPAGDCTTQRVHIQELASFPHQTLNVAWDGVSATIDIALLGGVCPLVAANGYSGPTNIVIVPASTSTPAPGPTFTPGWVTKRCTPDVVACTCALAVVPGVTDDVETSSLVTAWGKARVAVGETVTLARDATANELLMRHDFDNDGDRDEVRMIDGVHGINLVYGLVALDNTLTYVTAMPVTDFRSLRLVRLELALGLSDPNIVGSRTVNLTNGAVTVAKRKLTRSNSVALLATASSF